MVEATKTETSSAPGQSALAEESHSKSLLDNLVQQFRDLGELAGASWGAASSVGQLAAAELALALSVVPKIAAAGIIMIPLAMFFWLGVSATLAYLGYVFWDDLLAAFLIFTVLQALSMVVLYMRMRSWKSKMQFSGTRRQISTISEAIKDETRSHSRTDGEQSAAELRPSPGHSGAA